MDLASEGSDRACIGVGGVMADDAPTGAVLLVGDAHGSTGGGGKGGMVSSVGDDGMVCGVKGYIVDPELFRSPSVAVVMTGVFAYS